MSSLTHALFVLLTVISTAATAESRFVGMFDNHGLGVLLDTGPRVPKAKVTMPAGHVSAADLELPPHTSKRFSVADHSSLNLVMTSANQRFAEKLEDMRRNPELVRIAKKVAPAYGVDAAAVVAAVAVELTFNNDYSMGIQNLAAYLPSQSFYPGVADLRAKLEMRQLKMCHPERSDYWSWVCLNIMWDNSVLTARGVRGLITSQAAYIPLDPNEDSMVAKLSPKLAMLPAGVSFGPAQITLFRALMASEDVTRVTNGRIPRVTIDDMPAVQRMISQIEPSVHIIAATLGRSAYAYRKYARIDIAPNIGILSTLFNLGYEIQRSAKLQRANMFLKSELWILPRENYFGYFANEHEKEIRALVQDVL